MAQIIQNIPVLNFIFLDLIHLFFYIFIISFIFFLRIIDKNIFLLLLILSPTPFVFNNFFFVNFFPDTKDYLETFMYHRDHIELDPGYLGDDKILNYTYLLSYIPIPLIFSIIGMGYINKFIYTLLIIYLFNKNNKNILLLILIIITPEFIMYSSVGLKETVIIFLMTIFLINYESKKYILSIFFLIPIYFIKFQSFYFVIYFVLIHQFINIIGINKNFTLKFIIVIFLSIITFIFLLNINLNIISEIVLKVDFYCRKLNYNSDICYKDIRELIFNFDNSFINFILTPLIQKKISILLIMQFLSSSYYFLFLVILIYFSSFTNEIKMTSIIYLLSLGLLLALIFKNDGLLTRQKFSTFYPLVLFLFTKTELKRITFYYKILKKIKKVGLINKKLKYKN